MKLIEERIQSQIRQQIRQQRAAQLKINLSSGCSQVQTKHYGYPRNILIEEIGWEAYEWERGTKGFTRGK